MRKIKVQNIPNSQKERPTCFAHSSTFSNKQLFTMDSQLLVCSECGESAIQRVHIRGWQRTHNPFCAGPRRCQQPDEGRRKSSQKNTKTSFRENIFGLKIWLIYFLLYTISVTSDGFVCEHVIMTFCCIRLGRALASTMKVIWPVRHPLITWVLGVIFTFPLVKWVQFSLDAFPVWIWEWQTMWNPCFSCQWVSHFYYKESGCCCKPVNFICGPKTRKVLELYVGDIECCSLITSCNGCHTRQVHQNPLQLHCVRHQAM